MPIDVQDIDYTRAKKKLSDWPESEQCRLALARSAAV
jgi:hypothetical protein